MKLYFIIKCMRWLIKCIALASVLLHRVASCEWQQGCHFVHVYFWGVFVYTPLPCSIGPFVTTIAQYFSNDFFGPKYLRIKVDWKIGSQVYTKLYFANQDVVLLNYGWKFDCFVFWDYFCNQVKFCNQVVLWTQNYSLQTVIIVIVTYLMCRL